MKGNGPSRTATLNPELVTSGIEYSSSLHKHLQYNEAAQVDTTAHAHTYTVYILFLEG